MAFSFELGLVFSAELYGAISAGPEHLRLAQMFASYAFAYPRPAFAGKIPELETAMRSAA